MNRTKNQRLLTQGYSLLELVLVLAIVSVLVGLLLPKGFDALRNARIQQVAKTVDTLKTALADYITLPGRQWQPAPDRRHQHSDLGCRAHGWDRYREG